MPILKKTLLVAFEIEYDPAGCDPNSDATRTGKSTLADIATYLDGLVRRNREDPGGAKFCYNLLDPEVFPASNCTPQLLAQLRRNPDGEEGQEDQDPDSGGVRKGDQHPLW